MKDAKLVGSSSIEDGEREGNDSVAFNLYGRLFNSLNNRGIPKHELEAVINGVLGQISTMSMPEDVLMFPDGSRWIYQSGPHTLRTH